MKVLQVSDLYPPVVGGLELAVRALSRELVRRGHEVTVATQTDAVAEEGVGVVRLGGWGKHLLRRSYHDPSRGLHPTAPDPGIVRGLQRTIDHVRPEIIHVHGWISHSLLAVPSFRRAVVVLGVHDYGLTCAKKTLIRDDVVCPGPSVRTCPACASRHYGRTAGLMLTAGLRAFRPLLRRVDGFVANSRAIADALRPILHADATIQVIPPALDLAGATEHRPSFLPRADGFVLFVGALGPHKGLDVLLEAHERFGLGAELVVIGPRLADTPTRFPDGVTVVEGVDHSLVLAAWRHCSVAVVPSVWPEPFGMVAVEAMAAGKPVVASDVGALREIVTDQESGILVPAGDARALADEVRALIADESTRSRMGVAARKRAELFSLDRSVDLVERFYSSCAASVVPAK